MFPPPLLICRLSTVFFSDSETNETILPHFPRCFLTFITRKTIPEKLYPLNVCEATLQAARAYKRRELWRETHKSLWLLIGRTTFLTPPIRIANDVYSRIISFSCENPRAIAYFQRDSTRPLSCNLVLRELHLFAHVCWFIGA